ncbi:MAG: alanine--tRNA ligase [Candidatus Absconditabacteria bacterium]
MNSQDIRNKFIEFFQTKDHSYIPSAPCIPENDPTVLFNTAGMQPLVPYLLGEKHPLGKRIVDYQKCIRTNDIEDVGDNTHLTFFEMLGNWSLGDYFKKDSIAWSYEFLTDKKWLGIDPNKIAVTVFAGDENAPVDEESANLWKSLGITNISYLGKEDNWWGPAGLTGPCGPDTEIFYRVGEKEFPVKGSTVENDSKNWMEIWNNVFMEYIKNENGEYLKSPMQNVDTGMGLERITSTLAKAPSVYETDIFADIVDVICKVLNVEYNDENKTPIRIIADHTRASVIMISDGISPSNVDQGYILRRLIRRAIRNAHKLGFKGQFMGQVALKVIEKFANIYESVNINKSKIIEDLNKEEKQFVSTLEKGLKEFDKLIAKITSTENRTYLSGDEAFNLFQTYGFPIEMIEELSFERGFTPVGQSPLSKTEFDEAFKKHQEMSRAGAEQKFKSGLADTSEETTKYHTTTHLLNQALKNILGEHVVQKGANITAERIRFDFAHPEKLTDDQKLAIENMINNWIEAGFDVAMEEMELQQALDAGAIGAFTDRYDMKVRVFTITDRAGNVISKEICSGPHIENSNGLGKFKIQKEEASSAGVRRIKAIFVS